MLSRLIFVFATLLVLPLAAELAYSNSYSDFEHDEADLVLDYRKSSICVSRSNEIVNHNLMKWEMKIAILRQYGNCWKPREKVNNLINNDLWYHQ